MEIEINKEIRNYNESIFFGPTLRQCIFSGMALIFSVLIYFILSPFLPIAIWSLICILGSNSDCRHWIYQIQRYVRRGIYRCIDKVSVHTKTCSICFGTKDAGIQ